MNYEVEFERNNVTPAHFLASIRAALKAKNIDTFVIDTKEFANPERPCNHGYNVTDGVKHSTDFITGYNWKLEPDNDFKAEHNRSLPYDYQTYYRYNSGEVYNQIIEFTFDNEKTGRGYFYEMANFKEVK